MKQYVVLMMILGLLVPSVVMASISPPNDACTSPTSLGGLPALVSGATTDATTDAVPGGVCGTLVNAPGVWYTVVGTGNTMTASTCGMADYDTKLSVFCADCPNLTCVAGNDDDPFNCSDFTSQVSWCSVKDSVYRILVHGFNGNTGSFDLSVTDNGTPCMAAVTCSVEAGFCNGVPATLIGTGDADTLTGTSGDDVIVGLGGNDTIRGRGGNDLICGGPGADELFGGRGNDTIFGGSGKDDIFGDGGNDQLFGEGGADEIEGGNGNDTLRGGGGRDFLNGQGGTDDCAGGPGNDRIRRCE